MGYTQMVQQKSRWFSQILVAGALVAAFVIGTAASPPQAEEEVESLQITGYTFEGEYLVFRYTVPFPGMTKVRLYDTGLTLLWRNQYVDDKKGDHRIALRATKLSSGVTYLFEFDYKGKVIRQAVTAP